MIPTLDIHWPRPSRVGVAITAKTPSSTGFGDANLAMHVGDETAAVATNRSDLAGALGVAHWQWLNQVHGSQVVIVDSIQNAPMTADAISTSQAKIACAVLTADCLPVLLAAKDASQVAVAHAGWRGLAAGVIENAVSAFSGKALTAFLGPAIGPSSFEVGVEVKQAFILRMGERASAAFTVSANREGHYLADLYALARMELGQLGIDEIYGGGWDTYVDTRFYSYRREAVTGRMVSAIWLE